MFDTLQYFLTLHLAAKTLSERGSRNEAEVTINLLHIQLTCQVPGSANEQTTSASARVVQSLPFLSACELLMRTVQLG